MYYNFKWFCLILFSSSKTENHLGKLFGIIAYQKNIEKNIWNVSDFKRRNIILEVSLCLCLVEVGLFNLISNRGSKGKEKLYQINYSIS